MYERPDEPQPDSVQSVTRISLWTSDPKGVTERDLDPTSATEAAIDAGIDTEGGFTVTIWIGEQWLIIGGHENWLTCTVAPETPGAAKVFDLVGSTEPGEREILLGGQWIYWPRRLLVSRELVLGAARTFRATSGLDMALDWQQQD
jgi:hypothetical protein